MHRCSNIRRLGPWHLAVVAVFCCSLARGESPYLGRPVSEVLGELQDSGLSLIYNDKLVPPSMVVRREPPPGTALEVATSILEPHKLQLQRVGAAIWSVVVLRKPAVRVPLAVHSPGQSVTRPLEEVVVSASRYALARSDSAPATFFSGEELSSLPRLADEPLRAVHRLPGAASNGLSGLAHIRGGEENETQIVLDGQPLLEPFHLKNVFSPVSVLNAGIVDTLAVYAGGFPARYGDHMSAILDVSSVDPADGGGGEVGLSLFHANALGSGRFADDRGRWLLSARRSNLTEVVNLLDSDFGEPRYADAFGKVELDVSDYTTAAMHVLLADDQVELQPSGDTEFSRARDRNYYIWGSLEHRWSEMYAGSAALAYTEIENDRVGWVNEPDEQVGSVDDQRTYKVSSVRLGLSRDTERVRAELGLEISRLDATYRYQSELVIAGDASPPGSPPAVVIRDSRLDPDGYRFGSFLTSRWQITDKLTGDFGLRWDDQTYDNIDGRTQVSPRVSLLYSPIPQTRIRASWGRFFQPQAINEIQVEDGVENFWPAQRADHWIVSGEHDFPGRIGLRLEGYIKDYAELKPRFENLFDPLVLIPELEPDRVAIYPDSGEVRGIEVLLNQRHDERWNWWLNYTWSQARDRIAGVDVPRSWNQRDSFGAGVDWDNPPWQVTLAGTYHTGWATTPTTLGSPPAPGAEPPIDLGARNSARLGSFRSLDLRVGYTVRLEDSELETFVDITNVLAWKNPCCVDDELVTTPSGEYRLVREYDVWPRIVPNIGVAWRF